MKILRVAGIALAVFLGVGIVGAGFARLVINGPIGPLAGGELDGHEKPAPRDWSFTDEHLLIAVEVRPSDPHSVTVICFVQAGELYIPAQDGIEKDWTQMAIADGRARLRIGEDLYPVRLVRVDDASEREAVFQSAAKKYPQIAERGIEGLPEGVWLFRAERRS